MIIVGIDYSDGSAAAMRVAQALAGSGSIPVQPIHVRSTAGHAEVDLRVARWLRSLSLSVSDVEVRHGVPWVELVRAAAEHDAALLITGTHGTSGFQPFKLGGTAELVALRSATPVVLVPYRSSVPTTVGR